MVMLMNITTANLLKDVLNTIKLLYDSVEPLEEELVRPLIVEAMEIARKLKLPYDIDEANGCINQWLYISPKTLENINHVIKELYKMGIAG